MNSQQQKWNDYAAVYDKRRFALMPGYSAMLDAIISAIPFYDQFVSYFKDSGFRNADCIWKYYGLAVVAGRKG